MKTKWTFLVLICFFFTTSLGSLLILTALFFFPGGWWWLWCVLYYCWGKPYHIPHLQQILLSQHCKKDQWPKPKNTNKKNAPFIIFESVLCSVSPSPSVCVTCRTRVASVSTFPRPCLTSERFSRWSTRRKRRGMKSSSSSSWKTGRSTCDREAKSHPSCSSLLKTEHFALSHFRSWPFHTVRRKGRFFLFIYLYMSELHCFWCWGKAVLLHRDFFFLSVSITM